MTSSTAAVRIARSGSFGTMQSQGICAGYGICCVKGGIITRQRDAKIFVTEDGRNVEVQATCHIHQQDEVHEPDSLLLGNEGSPVELGGVKRREFDIWLVESTEARRRSIQNTG